MMTLKSLPGHLARRFHQISTALFDVEMRRAFIDLTPIQYAALVAVRRNPDIDQATLASLIAYDRTTIGGVVDRLVEKGLLARQSSLVDRRSKLLSITDGGVLTLEKAEPLVIHVQEQLVESLTVDEVEELMRLLEKVVGSLGDVSRSAK